MKWVWAAYRKGALKDLSEFFSGDPKEFTNEWAALLDSDIYCWICVADTPQGRVPVGLALGRPFVYGMLLMGNLTWFPWASERNIYESTVNLVNDLRKEAVLLFHVEQHDKEFAVQMCRHGIMRRVGTLMDVENGPLAVFQSRSPQWVE